MPLNPLISVARTGRALFSPYILAVLIGAAFIAAAGAVQVQQPRSTSTYRQFAPGLLVRTRFGTAAGSNRVELWDLLVGPGLRSGSATLPGGAVLEVRGGAGRIVIDGKEQELQAGKTLAVPDRTAFVLVNTRMDVGLSIRATVITGGRQ
jgi:hypothetical protein